MKIVVGWIGPNSLNVPLTTNHLKMPFLFQPFTIHTSLSNHPPNHTIFSTNIHYFIIRSSVQVVIFFQKLRIYYKGVVRSSLQPMWDHTIHLSWGPISSLTHRSVSRSDTICNNQSSLLTNIVHFDPLRILVSLTILKCVCSIFTQLQRVLLSLLQLIQNLTDKLSCQPCYYFICNSQSSLLTNIVRFGPSRIVVNITILKCVGQEEIFTPL